MPLIEDEKPAARAARNLAIAGSIICACGIGLWALVIVLCPSRDPVLPDSEWLTRVEAVKVGLLDELTLASIGDVNGDGFEDVAVGIPRPHEGSARIRLLSGKSGQVVRTIHSQVSNNSSLGRLVVRIDDVDGGGVADIVSTVSSRTLAVLSLETGNMITPIPIADGNAQALFVVGDIDKDGLSDLGLVLGHPRPRIETRSTSNGAVLHTISSIAQQRFSIAKEDCRRWVACSMGDLDGDAIADLAVGSTQATDCEEMPSIKQVGLVAVISGGTLKELWVLPSLSEDTDWPSCLLALPDLDGDGNGEIAIGSPGKVELRSGSTGFLIAEQQRNPRTGWGRELKVGGDLDGDKVPEILVYCPYPAASIGTPFASSGIFEILSGASLSLLGTLLLPFPYFQSQVIAVDDADGDGLSELVLCAPVADQSAVDLLCCDSLRAPSSWVAMIPGSLVLSHQVSGGKSGLEAAESLAPGGR